ncbi:MAG TPA: hypothetical protein VF756_14255 [Thermoanaerobaculia bacterium]
MDNLESLEPEETFEIFHPPALDEASYVEWLLRTLAQGPFSSVRLASGRPLPHLAALAWDPDELDRISRVPFRYDKLNADKAIQAIVRMTRWDKLGSKAQGVLSTSIAFVGKRSRRTAFHVATRKEPEGRAEVTITKH